MGLFMADVVLANVTKHFGDTVAVSDLTIEIADGSFMVLLGPTGAGKTTTLRLVAGLEVPDHGRVAIGDRDVTAAPPAARDVAFVFQQYSLYPHLSVYDNLAFPLRSPTRRTPEDEIRRKVTETAALLHIESKLGNRATNLSGGEMQRVALGRALVRRPAIYLMDEPLSSLDAKLRADLRLELKRIQMELGATLLYVTHDQIEAMTMATTIGVIQSGRIAQIGTPRQIYETPNSLYVAARLGQPSINLLPRRLLPGIAAPSEATTIGARTEHLRIAKARGAEAHGRVTWIEHLGDQNHLHIKIDQHEVVTLVDPDAGLAVGDEVGIVLVRPLYFDQNGIRIAT
ncbi:ABC transporter ATP-binding protein [Labrys miyagiensis]|uniref:ABC transporter ATP-binding protein n=2 Tax=Labrys miyagiensis TaxID=346912 RepID=A0ABQ6CU13_9HYPH|nr:ABC transporter ATP-binding protein [Labrys miyagiensis]